MKAGLACCAEGRPGLLSSWAYKPLGTCLPGGSQRRFYDRNRVRNHSAPALIDPKEKTMSNRTIDALHDIHTATNDVLKGYREMLSRAQPDIQAVVRRLTDMHQRHASEQEAELVRLRDAGKDDTSMQGTLNKVVVVMRDWVSDLDRDALPAVRQGEESLRDEYNKALQDLQVMENASVVTLLKTQCDAICSEIARLPKS